ncbi:MAG: tape measure protein [Acidaminococcales bacterium]|jgi:tape measure domain-containing protein|nr:tape measure protein [Acidaminococcales bacterium]
MAEVASLSVRISANISQFNKEIRNLQNDMKRAFSGQAMAQSKAVAVGLAGIAAGLAAAGAAAVKMAADMEQTRMAFTTLLKDAGKADAFLREMEKFAKTTPFDMPGVLNASKMLLAFGFQAEQVKPMLTSIGDASSALGLGADGVQRLTLALGQMNAAGKVNAQDMRQLVTAGVPAWEFLAKSADMSVAQIQETVRKGAIDSATGIQAIINGMNGQFGGMMANQEKTLLGMWTNIQEGLGIVLRDIGDEIVKTFDLHEKMGKAKEAITQFSETVRSQGVGGALRQLIPPETVSMIYAFSGAVVAAAVPALASMTFAATQTAVAFAPMIGVGALAGAAVYLLTSAGLDLKEALLVVGTVLAVLFLPQIKIFIATVGTGAVTALSSFLTTLGLAPSAFFLTNAATWAGVLSMKTFAVATALALLPIVKLIAIAAVIAMAAMTIYKNWDRLTASFGTAGSRITAAVGKLITFFKPLATILIMPLLLFGATLKAMLIVIVEFATTVLETFARLATEIDEAMSAAKAYLAKFADSLPDWAKKAISWIGSVTDKLIEFIGFAREAEVVKLGVGDFRMAEREDTKKPGIDHRDANNLGLSSSPAKEEDDKDAKKREKAISKINEKLAEMRDKTREAGFEFEKFKVGQMFDDLKGGDAVIGNIWKQAIDDVLTLQAEVKRLADAQKEAQDIYNEAQKSGTAEQIAEAKAQFDTIAQMKINAEQYAADRTVEINKRAQKETESLYTQTQAFKASLDEAYRQGDIEAYMQQLTDENVAQMTALTERQALMQQLYDWRMEAEQSFLVYQLEAMKMLKSGVSDAFAEAVMGGESFSKALQKIGKDIAKMFLQMMASQAMAAVFGKLLAKQGMAMQKAQIAAIMPAASALAWNVLVYNPGAAGIATGLQATGVAGAVALGASTSLAGNERADPNGLASGGIVRNPTIAMIGEGKYNEAVIPLYKGVLDDYISDGAGGATITYNQYGDIRTERDAEVYRDELNAAIYAGLRGAR